MYVILYYIIFIILYYIYYIILSQTKSLTDILR